MKQLRITVNGQSYHVTVEKLDGSEFASATPPVQRAAPAAHVAAPVAAPKPTMAAGQVPSPLAGIVKAIDAAVGTKVKTGDLVLTLEAMKMYTAMNAPTDGTITEFHVKVGEAVDEGQPLYTRA